MNKTRRTGLIFSKLGMSAVYTDQGQRIPVTVLRLKDELQVTKVQTMEKDGYLSLQLGWFETKNRSNPKTTGDSEAKSKPKKQKLLEFKVSEDQLKAVGTTFSPDHFQVGQLVDVVATSIGKGFAGTMKRYNFSGGRASHGASKSHRSAGSTGQCQDPGRVHKGKKMAGRMGNRRVTVSALKVIEVDTAKGYLVVKGGVPGAKNATVQVKDSHICAKLAVEK